MKVCGGCKAEKPASEFWIDRKHRAAPKKRAGRKKGTKNKPRVPVPPVDQTPAAATPLPIASVPGGNSRPALRFNFDNVETLVLIIGAALCILAGAAACYFLTGAGR